MTKFPRQLEVLSQFFFLHVSVLHQNQFLCLAVLRGTLKVFFDFSGNLEEMEPKDLSSDLLKISDSEPKTVSLPCVSVPLSVFVFPRSIY